MEDYTFLVFLFTVSIGILFVGSGITGLYSIDINNVEYCDDRGDCDYGKVCCGFKEGDNVFRICAEDCRSIKSLSREVNYNEQTVSGFALGITGGGVKDVKEGVDYWTYILIGIILILLALFYKKNPKDTLVNIKRKKR